MATGLRDGEADDDEAMTIKLTTTRLMEAQRRNPTRESGKGSNAAREGEDELRKNNSHLYANLVCVNNKKSENANLISVLRHF